MFFLSIFILIGLGDTASAQTSISSPYSAFGLGNLYQTNNIRYKGMGNTSLAGRDYFTINVNNPASYTAFDSTSFVFEAAVIGHSTTLRTNELNETINSATMSHLIFGFPVTNWWRSSFGLLPYSGVGYNVTDTKPNDNLGDVTYLFEGEGGLSRAYLGNGFKLTKFMSVGVNASYLFGTINRIQRVTFPDTTNVLNSRVDDATSVSDIYLDFGVQFHMPINEKLNLTIGATYNPRYDLNAKKTYLSRTYVASINNVDIIQDTALFIDNIKGTVSIPDAFGFGFNISKEYDWSFAADYKYNNWADYEAFGLSDSLESSHSFNGGLSLIPDRNSMSYFSRVEYRFGGYYQISNLKLRNQPINGFGITFGTGLPLRGANVRGSKSMFNISFEYGRRGTIEKGLIREDYFNIHLGISVYEWWFFKRRYK